GDADLQRPRRSVPRLDGRRQVSRRTHMACRRLARNPDCASVENVQPRQGPKTSPGNGLKRTPVFVKLMSRFALLVFAALLLSCPPPAVHAGDPLPSWNEGPSKKAIVEFVSKVTAARSPDFVPVEERIATFDNDGTLWVEQPMYSQFLFALDRVKALAPD